jgi:hypothetical protein
MKKADKVRMAGIIDNEGFDYAFRYYSSFEDVKDPKFHELRKAYVEAAKALCSYIGLED